MAGVAKTKLTSGKYRAWFMTWEGKQKFFTGTTNQKETQLMAERLEDHHRRIKVGDLPPPQESDKPRLFAEVAKEYLAWGAAQGGHGGRPWSPVHVTARERHLTKFWPQKLELRTLKDISFAEG